MDQPTRPARLAAPPGDVSDLDAYRLPDGRLLALFAAVAHSAPALADLRGATARALQATSLAVRPRELLILRILHIFGAQAESQAHVALFGDRAMIGDDEKRAIAGTRVNSLGDQEQLMIELADGLCAGGHLTDALWARLIGSYGESGAVEAVFIGAQYIKVAVMNNALEVAPPFGAAPTAGSD